MTNENPIDFTKKEKRVFWIILICIILLIIGFIYRYDTVKEDYGLCKWKCLDKNCDYGCAKKHFKEYIGEIDRRIKHLEGEQVGSIEVEWDILHDCDVLLDKDGQLTGNTVCY